MSLGQCLLKAAEDGHVSADFVNDYARRFEEFTSQGMNKRQAANRLQAEIGKRGRRPGRD
jgi:hypothetical protein